MGKTNCTCVIDAVLSPWGQPDPGIRRENLFFTVEIDVALALQADVGLLHLVPTLQVQQF